MFKGHPCGDLGFVEETFYMSLLRKLLTISQKSFFECLIRNSVPNCLVSVFNVTAEPSGLEYLYFGLHFHLDIYRNCEEDVSWSSAERNEVSSPAERDEGGGSEASFSAIKSLEHLTYFICCRGKSGHTNKLLYWQASTLEDVYAEEKQGTKFRQDYQPPVSASAGQLGRGKRRR